MEAADPFVPVRLLFATITAKAQKGQEAGVYVAADQDDADAQTNLGYCYQTARRAQGLENRAAYARHPGLADPEVGVSTSRPAS